MRTIEPDPQRSEQGQIELNLGHWCNNRCLFCVSGQLTERRQAGHSEVSGLLAELDAAAARGVQTVTLLGGEPTLHPQFLELVDHAVGLGFSEIVIFSNGARAADPGFLREVCARGRFTWRFSIQGGTREAHDHTTQRTGAFDRIVRGLRTLQALGQRTTVNLCVNGANAASLPELPAVIGPLGVVSFHADMVRPHSVGDRTEAELDALIAPYSEVALHLRAMLANFARLAPQVEVRIGNLPFCVLPEQARRITHGGQQTQTITADSQGVELGESWDKYAYQADHRTHPPACEACFFRPRCVGVPDAYLARFGPAEFAPVLVDPELPTPRAHLAGTLRLVERIAAVAGFSGDLQSVRTLLDRPDALPAAGDGLKYDAYLSSSPERTAWGFTINSRWEDRAVLPAMEQFVRGLGGDFAWDEVVGFWERLGGVLTLGVGFDRPGAPPRLKFYAQEDAWGAGLAGREVLAGQVEVPAWIERIDVATLELHADGRSSWKLYTGGATAAESARGAPESVQRLARRMERLCPLEPAWYYTTTRLGPEPRYAVNKIYAPGLRGSASWRDVAALFAGAGQDRALKQILERVARLEGVRVLPTASAVEDGGRSVDVYCAAWTTA